MVSFALTEVDFAPDSRLDNGLRRLSGLAELADLTGAAPDLFLFLFLSAWLALGASRLAGVCAKACGERTGMEKAEKTKRIENRK
jgi:hypothetical protein